MVDDDMREAAFRIREAILVLEPQVKALMQMSCSDEARGEAAANTMLAFRHLEDARMRLGKVCQAVDGGVSCYPR